MSYQFATTERDGHVLIVTINRPDRMNALHPPANAELESIFNDFAADPDLWVAILTGAGDRAFCAGNDLRWQAEGNPITVPATGFAGLTSRWDLDKPVIAAVNGVAMGGGFEIALACDLILAADSAAFALPEPKVGLAALAGGLHRLPRTIGVKRAIGMILTGRSVPAVEGKALGFVHDVVPAADLMAAARTLAAQICELSPMSIRASKQVVSRSLDTASLKEAYEGQMAHPAVAALWRSEDLREGPLAFAQKRKPEWKGR
jgi:crotonobetainyl-CoA hydratase